MVTSKKKFKTVDEYIGTFPVEVQKILKKIRKIIQAAAPEAQDAISYQIPTFKLHGRYIVYFAGWKSHVSLYPIPTGSEAFQKEIALYIAGKGTLKFPLNKPIPYSLIKKVVTLHIKEKKSSY